MTHGDLFSGIGGFSLGFQWAGIKTVWQVEIDEYCRKVLARHFPDAKRYTDIKEVGEHNLSPVDIISGGVPCQDVSVAGKRKGLIDENGNPTRSGLWFEMFRVCSELRPRFIVIENVPNLVRLGLDRVLADLASIGYDAEWQIISARDVGAPHLRKRIWIVAYPSSVGRCKSNNEREQQGRTKIERASEVMSSGEIAKHKRANKDAAYSQRSRESQSQGVVENERRRISNSSEDDADSLVNAQGGAQRAEGRGQQYNIGHDRNKVGNDAGDLRCAVPDTASEGLEGKITEGELSRQQPGLFTQCGWWSTEPNVGGNYDGFPMFLYKHTGREINYAESNRRTKVLQNLWNKDLSEAIQWAIRGFNRLETAEVLFAFVCEYERGGWLSREQCKSKKALEEIMRDLWWKLFAGGSPHRWEQVEQYRKEHTNIMCEMPFFSSSWESGINRTDTNIPNRTHRLRGLGNSIIPQIAEIIGRLIND